ncbi:hypothetical protein CPLU01_08314 [Colletotrichum plurivorum]|uniref:Uncharacterized protein n=1 Tax=Colletotrichum plurivorum TaxID=2175906 RepID=A0A8H6KCH2_9PEZI|nr:hypothetical protein CPLU01_08314 [Colletotrichum plurivorum]
MLSRKMALHVRRGLGSGLLGDKFMVSSRGFMGLGVSGKTFTSTRSSHPEDRCLRRALIHISQTWFRRRSNRKASDQPVRMTPAMIRSRCIVEKILERPGRDSACALTVSSESFSRPGRRRESRGHRGSPAAGIV